MQSLKCPQCKLVNFASAETCKRCNALLNEASDSNLRSNWYYSEEGKRIGPVNEYSLKQLAGSGAINAKTLVWQSGMADWTMAYQTDLASLFASPRNEPPPLIGEQVNNNLVWAIAFAPLIAAFLRIILGAMFGMPPNNLWWIAIVLNVCLIVADINQLKNAGHNTKNMGVWALILLPSYLFVRANRLKQNNSYAIVWVIAFVISIFIF